jgi:hypothetical protein
MLVALTGAVWALFCWWLARAGHAPSRTLVPIPREHYYFAQAGFIVPLLLLQWALLSIVSTRVSRALGGSASVAASAAALASALYAPLIGLFLLPDLLVYVCFGFTALAKLFRFTAPLSFAATLYLATRQLARVQQLTTSRALLAALAGVFVQAFVGGLLLR